jgi:hypothetical protein
MRVHLLLTLQPIQRKLLLAVAANTKFSHRVMHVSRFVHRFCSKSVRESRLGSLELTQPDSPFVVNFHSKLHPDYVLLSDACN